MTDLHEDGVRSDMTKYWVTHANEATEQKMMLDSDAKILGQRDIPEILSLLPEYKGKDILELGAGIGRFTGILAKKASHVTAVDFMQSFIDKNRDSHGHMANIDFLCLDVTTLELPPRSVDMIFSNWLFMYLSDAEVQNLFSKMLSWLRDDGLLFFRESCFHKSGGIHAPGENPTKYRAPDNYNSMLASAEETVANGHRPGKFQVDLQTPVQAYIQIFQGNSRKSGYDQFWESCNKMEGLLCIFGVLYKLKQDSGIYTN